MDESWHDGWFVIETEQCNLININSLKIGKCLLFNKSNIFIIIKYSGNKESMTAMAEFKYRTAFSSNKRGQK